MDLSNNASIRLNTKKILLTGGAGFLGSIVVQKLLKRGVPNKNIFIPRSKDLDLRKWKNCLKVVKGQDIVIHLAAKVGGIGFNKEKPGEMFYDNIIMGVQLMEAARLAGAEKFVKVDKRYYRPAEVNHLVADISKAIKVLGWKPKTKFKDLVKIMVKADIEKIK